MLTPPPSVSYDANAYRPFRGKNVLVSIGVHVGVILLFVVIAKVAFKKPETLIPIDMTIVPPWAQQTDDPDPDPNPPPEPTLDEPKPPEPEPEQIDVPHPEAVEKIPEKPKEKPKPKVEKPKPKPPVDLLKNAKKIKTVQPPDLLKNAKKIEVPPNITKTGKGTANDKPMSKEEFEKWMNMGARIGAKNQLPTSEAQRCISMIGKQIQDEWKRGGEFKWYPGLVPLNVEIHLGSGGRLLSWKVLKGSGDPTVDQTARTALGRIKVFNGIPNVFVEQYPSMVIVMTPVGAH